MKGVAQTVRLFEQIAPITAAMQTKVTFGKKAVAPCYSLPIISNNQPEPHGIQKLSRIKRSKVIPLSNSTIKNTLSEKGRAEVLPHLKSVSNNVQSTITSKKNGILETVKSKGLTAKPSDSLSPAHASASVSKPIPIPPPPPPLPETVAAGRPLGPPPAPPLPGTGSTALDGPPPPPPLTGFKSKSPKPASKKEELGFEAIKTAKNALKRKGGFQTSSRHQLKDVEAKNLCKALKLPHKTTEILLNYGLEATEDNLLKLAERYYIEPRADDIRNQLIQQMDPDLKTTIDNKVESIVAEVLAFDPKTGQSLPSDLDTLQKRYETACKKHGLKTISPKDLETFYRGDTESSFKDLTKKQLGKDNLLLTADDYSDPLTYLKMLKGTFKIADPTTKIINQLKKLLQEKVEAGEIALTEAITQLEDVTQFFKRKNTL